VSTGAAGAVVFDLAASSPFGYRCLRCSRCCHGQRIPLNPYELVRIARNRGLCTGDIIARFTVEAGTVLRFGGPQDACVFLGENGCEVHPDRPLACRLYPLGRYVTPAGQAGYARLRPHPQSDGVFTPAEALGPDDTVERFVGEQGAEPYLRAADRYFELFRALRRKLQACARRDPAIGDIELRPKGIANWADVDAVIATTRCGAEGRPVPSDAEAAVDLHVEAMSRWADKLPG
jgi:uncharacterized protein